MSGALHIRFLLKIGERFSPVEDLPVDEYLDHAMRGGGNICCRFQGGLAIEINGVPWNGSISDEEGKEFFIDELVMTVNWYRALVEIMTGRTKIARFFYWEESNASMTLEDDSGLTLKDEAFGNIVFAPVTVDLRSFTHEVLREGHAFYDYTKQLLDEISRRLEAETDTKAKQTLEAMRKHIEAFNLGELLHSIANRMPDLV